MAPGGSSRASRGAARNNLSRRSARRSAADRDGDVKMGAEPKRSARIEKSSSSKNNAPASSARAPTTAGRRPAARGSRADLTNSRIQQRLARATANGDVSMKEERTPNKGNLAEFKVTGWYNSAASDAADHGSSALKRWLESKMRRKLETAKKGALKIKKSRVDGEALYVSVAESDSRSLERMNGYQWAKATLHIERVGGAVKGLSNEAADLKALLQDVLDRRYHAEGKYLDLSALGQDPELQAKDIFNSATTAKKFFPAMMKVLDTAFQTEEEKNAMFESVSLANNELSDLKEVTALSQTLPKIKNIDLSNNKLAKAADLIIWRRRLLDLQHLIVTGNPLVENEPNFAVELIQWFPTLMFINNTQVRSEEDIKNRNKVTNIPFPLRSPQFHDEGGIAQQFIINLIGGLDNDRVGLAQYYYDGDSIFSYAVNTSAPRDPSGGHDTEKGAWEPYLKNSLNLKKVNHPPARNARTFRGPEQVAAAFAVLPKTQHPDLLSEAGKWLIEAHLQKGLPDPTGQSPMGVDGFAISIHGEFLEVDDPNTTNKKRSVDHFIQIGPALPANSDRVVRVVSHMMTMRSYGGTQAIAESLAGGI